MRSYVWGESPRNIAPNLAVMWWWTSLDIDATAIVEVDDPTITQPLLYERIKNHPQLWKLYAKHTGIDPSAMAEQVRAEYEGEQSKAQELKKLPHLRQTAGLLVTL